MSQNLRSDYLQWSFKLFADSGMPSYEELLSGAVAEDSLLQLVSNTLPAFQTAIVNEKSLSRLPLSQGGRLALKYFSSQVLAAIEHYCRTGEDISVYPVDRSLLAILCEHFIADLAVLQNQDSGWIEAEQRWRQLFVVPQHPLIQLEERWNPKYRLRLYEVFLTERAARMEADQPDAATISCLAPLFEGYGSLLASLSLDSSLPQDVRASFARLSRCVFYHRAALLWAFVFDGKQSCYRFEQSLLAGMTMDCTPWQGCPDHSFM